jgi:competence protein ComEC
MKKIFLTILTMLMLTSCNVQLPETLQENIVYENQVSVVFINVGKADSILLTINDKAYVIDTGSKKSVPSLFRAFSVMGIEKIDGLFLTHTHSDHVGGTEALAEKYQIDRLYSAEISQNNKKGENKIVNLAEELELPHTKLKVGDSIEVESDIAFQVIAPIEYNEADDNDNSLVLMIELNGKRFLFTGDMQVAQELTVLNSGANISAHVLKVGNHGNPDATSSRFANAVSPEYAVISTDTNEDTNSANPSVIRNLNPAEVLITQDFANGIKMIVDINGNINVSELEPVISTANMEIVSIDIDEQTITIRNNGEQTDISGYFIFSERGSQVFVFPEGSVIDTEQVITVACIGGTGDYIWDDTNIWHKKNPDVGVLYDNFGNELVRK